LDFKLCELILNDDYENFIWFSLCS
jgi:hypothetical protein